MVERFNHRTFIINIIAIIIKTCASDLRKKKKKVNRSHLPSNIIDN